MKFSRRDVSKGVKKAITAVSERRIKPKDGDSLVSSLGFDSLKIASLSIALEGEFSQPFLLNDWISMRPDPQLLTVGSLRDYIWEILKNGRS